MRAGWAAVASALAVSTALSQPSLAQAPPAQPPGEPSVAEEMAVAEGRALARRWCASCHVAEGAGTDVVPPLAALGARRSPERLRQFLSAPHGGMPPLALDRREIEALLAYLTDIAHRP